MAWHKSIWRDRAEVEQDMEDLKTSHRHLKQKLLKMISIAGLPREGSYDCFSDSDCQASPKSPNIEAILSSRTVKSSATFLYCSPTSVDVLLAKPLTSSMSMNCVNNDWLTHYPKFVNLSSLEHSLWAPQFWRHIKLSLLLKVIIKLSEPFFDTPLPNCCWWLPVEVAQNPIGRPSEQCHSTWEELSHSVSLQPLL